MTLLIVGVNSVGPGVRLTLGAGDNLTVSAYGSLGSTDDTAVMGPGSNHSIIVDGSVWGVTGISLGSGTPSDTNNHLVVSKSGHVAADFLGVQLASTASEFDNFGTVWSALAAVDVSSPSSGSLSLVKNSGSILGQTGVQHSGPEALDVYNNGLIQAGFFAFDSSGNSVDRIFNSGRIEGYISLGEGDDLYDGQAGRLLDGAINCGNGNDTILAGVDNDTVFGLSGNDTLVGNGGNDLLDGGTGADRMSGGAGSDICYVDNAGDVVDETGGSGTETVLSTISFSLSNATHVRGGVENLSLQNSGAAINGGGNALANVIIGNSSNNVLDGYAGNDRLIGGGGIDTLRGGIGIDTLTGDAGADRFVFNSAVVAANRDIVTDFTHGVDKLWLDNAVFKTIGANGALNSAYFWIGAGAHDANDHVIYNKATGGLYYDDDGTGAHAGVLFATLTTKPTLSAGDFAVI